MTQWAIMSGILGNRGAYEAVLKDIRRQGDLVEQLFILGDVIGPTPESEPLIERLRDPKPRELPSQICRGWWEEQALILHGLGSTGDPTELREAEGSDAVEKLWKSVSRETVRWIRSLDFGFQELDCLLIHGSTLSASDSLTPQTPPLTLLDRVIRAGVNTLFCGRSGQAFHVQLQSGSLRETLQTLDGTSAPPPYSVQPRQVVGVGTVGGIPGQTTYTLYDPSSNRVQFRRVEYPKGGSRP